jgi:hypothetical protein
MEPEGNKPSTEWKYSFPDLKLVTEEEPAKNPVEEASKLIQEGKEFMKIWDIEREKLEVDTKELKKSRKDELQSVSALSEEEAEEMLKKQAREDRFLRRRRKDVIRVLKSASYCFSEASELMLDKFGPDAPEIAPSFYLYGTSLNTIVQETSTNIFSDPVEAEIEGKAKVIDDSFLQSLQADLDAESEASGERKEGASLEDEGDDMAEEEVEEEGKESGEEASQSNSEDSDSDSSSDTDSCDPMKPEDQTNQSELAWNILETARVALSNAKNPEQKYLLSEIHLALADIALESDHVEIAFGEFQKSIDIRVGLGDQRSIAEVYFFAGIAIQTEKREESLEFVQKAQSILEELALTADAILKEELDAILVDVRKRVFEIKDYIENMKKLMEAEAEERVRVKPDLPTAITDFGTVGGMKKKTPTLGAKKPATKTSGISPKTKKKTDKAKATKSNNNASNNSNSNSSNNNTEINDDPLKSIKRKAPKEEEDIAPNKKQKDEK